MVALFYFLTKNVDIDRIMSKMVGEKKANPQKCGDAKLQGLIN